MIILGLNAYHPDSSACIIVDGVLIAAIEEERLKRIKHWSGFPALSIEYCLKEANCTLDEVSIVAVNQDKTSNLFKKINYGVQNLNDINFLLKKFTQKSRGYSVRDDLKNHFKPNSEPNIKYVEHHLSHLASSFYPSPFKEASLVSIDGFGDFASTAWGVGRSNTITMHNKIYFPHSLGIFYQAITQWLGFNNYGDEYKIMGLAPYGTLKSRHLLEAVVKKHSKGEFKLNLEFFRHHKLKLDMQWSDTSPTFPTLFNKRLEDLIGPRRMPEEELTDYHLDIACATQSIYEEIFFHILNYVGTLSPNKNLCLSGGCAMNSSANGKIYKNTNFQNVYVQPAAGDAGGAIGAAFEALNKIKGSMQRFEMKHAYWGPSFSNEDIEKTLINKLKIYEYKNEFSIEQLSTDKIISKVTKDLINGKVIGWFQGRMEWGPRALGNRSILCDPRRSDMKNILNSKIKRRESFRPFAPSVLLEEAHNWFEKRDDVPFMMKVFKVIEAKQKLLPAITHVDGSGRLQTVEQKSNPKYYNLIKKFSEHTGVPLLLNTSFNENEPVVCSPEEALKCFLRTKMDTIVLENWIIRRRE